MNIHEMTWREIAKIDFDRTLVVVPVGATEQHGPHLPTNVDTLIVEALSQQLEKNRKDTVLLTPTLWLGHSPHHLSFGGTLSVDHRVYAAMLKAICLSYIGMGARRIWLLNGHGGNRMPLSVVLQELKNEHPQTFVAASEYWNHAREEIAAIRDSDYGGLGHACELETSLYLYLHEAGVRKELIRDDGHPPNGLHSALDMMRGEAFSAVYNFREVTASGVNGKPTLASKVKGERFYRAIAEKLTGFADQLLQHI